MFNFFKKPKPKPIETRTRTDIESITQQRRPIEVGSLHIFCSVYVDAHDIVAVRNADATSFYLKSNLMVHLATSYKHPERVPLTRTDETTYIVDLSKFKQAVSVCSPEQFKKLTEQLLPSAHWVKVEIV